MEKEAIIEQLKKQKGRAGELAKILIAYKEGSGSPRSRAYDGLCRFFEEGSPEDFGEIFEKGPRQLFTAVHGKAVADRAAEAARRLNLYVHSPSTYRRSFRSRELRPYHYRFITILDSLFFSWEDFDFVKDLTTPQNDRRTGRPERLYPWVYSDFLAVCIDQGDAGVIAAIKEIMLGDNNTAFLSDYIINGIVKSANEELWRLLEGLLLAAKLQEGLRQSILENADNGRVEFFIRMMKIVLDNDLLRYSSAVRALDVWMGLGESFEDKRVAAKLLSLGYAYLTDPKALAAGVESADVTELYAALWAASVREMNDAVTLIEKLLKGEKYRKLTALYFLLQTENDILQSFAAARLLGETDLDVLSLVMRNFLPSGTGWHRNAESFSDTCRSHRILSDGPVRGRQFQAIINMIPLLPAKGYTATGKPFPWCDLSLTPRDLFARLLIIAGYDFDPEKTERLIGLLPGSDPDSRVFFIRFFLENPEDEKSRAFVFASLNDKSISVRSQALKTILEFSKKSDVTSTTSATSVTSITAEEEKTVAGLLALKTGDLRQNALKILLSLDGERPLKAAKALLADRDENKRLAGLDMLAQLVKAEKLSRAGAAGLCALMPEVSDKERVLVDSLTTGGEKYSRANGFGLYDPAYTPDFPFPKTDKKHGLDSIFGFSPERIKTIFDALCDLIKEHRDYTYKLYNYEGAEETALGSLVWACPRAEAHNDERLTSFEKFVLQDLWRGWMKDHGVSFGEQVLFKFMAELGYYSGRYKPEYQSWANGAIEKLFRAGELDQFIVYSGKKEYGRLAVQIISIMRTEYPEDERFAVLSGALASLATGVSEADWKRSTYRADNDPEYDRYHEKETFADTREVNFFLDQMKKDADTDEHFKTWTRFCFTLGRLSGTFYRSMTTADVARAVEMGLVKIDVLYRAMFIPGEIRRYGEKNPGDQVKKELTAYPCLGKAAREAAARVIEIETRRGDSATEVSAVALTITRHEGAETFARLLVALGKETFVRGYIYAEGDPDKKTTLSSLLRASRPGPGDNAETLRAALAGKIADRRLIEAAMYAPAWIGIVGDYLGWPGLKSAAWYFHAHVNENFSAEKETEVARYSPITPEEFNDGAFDIAWFKEACAALGEERFALVYDCAKYLTSGANHRRAQLFADAALGKLDAAALWKEVHEKRSRDRLLSYALIPPEKGREQEAALERYENIQLFLKESKTFGAMRRASEGKACAIALENLARGAGFADTLRFSWRMEILKLESLKGYFEERAIGEYRVRLAIAEDGIAALICEKDGKALSSLPAALKKDPYVLECKESAAALRAQHKRARENLERAMVNRDIFPFGEIRALMDHPVVAPLLSKLVFVSLKDDGKAGSKAAGSPAASGAYCEFAGKLRDASPVRIAHPHDLYTLGTWRDCQRYAFEHKLVQPFKQIFRELYLLNDDEREAETLSRRYAGHQVQPKKTLALLKGRQWTVDYEEGLQRVYYRENLYVELYAAADWFSPADIEAPTLEAVEFFDRKTREAVPLKKVPPVIFSEVMRDIDLVVSVAHVGGVDPEASLSTVEMRTAIAGELLRLLRVDNVTVQGRHAKISGRLGEYTVHLGSAQVHKMGRGAVNILAVPGQHRGRVFLPFADDDPRTAEVMSKILLLAEDGTIKDPAILAQIG